MDVGNYELHNDQNIMHIYFCHEKEMLPFASLLCTVICKFTFTGVQLVRS